MRGPTCILVHGGRPVLPPREKERVLLSPVCYCGLVVCSGCEQPQAQLPPLLLPVDGTGMGRSGIDQIGCGWTQRKRHRPQWWGPQPPQFDQSRSRHHQIGPLGSSRASARLSRGVRRPTSDGRGPHFFHVQRALLPFPGRRHLPASWVNSIHAEVPGQFETGPRAGRGGLLAGRWGFGATIHPSIHRIHHPTPSFLRFDPHSIVRPRRMSTTQAHQPG